MPNSPDKPSVHPLKSPVLLDRADLHRRGIKASKSTLLRWEAQGAFPRRIRLGASGRTVCWSAQQVDEYLAGLSGKGEGDQ
jgi:prophage regulatory protein